MSQPRPPPKVEISKHENYRTIIVNGVFGGHRAGYFEAVIYTDEMVADESLSTIPPDPTKVRVKRELQCRLVMDPVQAKMLMKWLAQHIEQYEKAFGKIVLPGEEKGKGKKKPPPSSIIA